MQTLTDRVLIRSRFWPRYFRWALAFQFGWVLYLGIGVAIRVLNGQGLPPIESVLAWGIVSGVLAVMSLVLAAGRWNVDAADIIPRGIRPLRRASRWDRRYPWALIETVRVKAGPFGNRWLEVVPRDEPPFKLPARPSDPDAVLEALEQFAGPDHPLTQAYHALNPLA